MGGSASHDSNLFKRPDALKQSDTVTTGYVGLRLDKPYSLQRFKLDVTQTATRYGNFGYLNFDSLNYGGAWLWQLGPSLGGKLSADRKESLAPFEETLGVQRNARITEDRRFNLDWSLSGHWHLLAGVSRSYQKSEQSALLTQGESDFRSTGGEVGTRYETNSGNWLSAVIRSTQGNYEVTILSPGSTITDYREDESELKANWKPSAKTALSGRLAWRERTHDNVSQRDFSGRIWDMRYEWVPREKLSANLSAARNIAPQGAVGGSTVTTDTFSLGSAWRMAPKTTVHLLLSRIYRNYPGILATGFAGRTETQDGAGFGVNWLATRSISVDANLQYDQRSSMDPRFQFEAARATISASLAF